MSYSLIPCFLMSDVSESLRVLTKNKWCERIAQLAHQKWATMSDLLRKPMGEFPALTKRNSPSSSSSFSSPLPRYKAWCLLPVSFSSCSPACSAAHSPGYQVTYWTNLPFSSSYSIVNILFTVSSLGLLTYLCWLKWCWTFKFLC